MYSVGWNVRCPFVPIYLVAVKILADHCNRIPCWYSTAVLQRILPTKLEKKKNGQHCVFGASLKRLISRSDFASVPLGGGHNLCADWLLHGASGPKNWEFWKLRRGDCQCTFNLLATTSWLTKVQNSQKMWSDLKLNWNLACPSFFLYVSNGF